MRQCIFKFNQSVNDCSNFLRMNKGPEQIFYPYFKKSAEETFFTGTVLLRCNTYYYIVYIQGEIARYREVQTNSTHRNILSNINTEICGQLRSTGLNATEGNILIFRILCGQTFRKVDGQKIFIFSSIIVIRT